MASTGDSVPKTQLLLLLLLLSLCHLARSIDPAGNSEVPACVALVESLGPDALPRCHVTLSPKQFGYEDSATVKVSLDVQTVYGLDEKELLEWSGWVVMVWQDPRLAWNATKAGITRMRMDRGNVWLPDIALWNVKDSSAFDLRNAQFQDIVVFSTGEAHALLYVVIQLPCEMDVRMFPFDRQSCMMEVGTLVSDSSFFNFTLVTHNYDLESMFHVGEWNLRSLSQAFFTAEVRNLTLPYYIVSFHLERRITYYIVLMIVPFELLALLASIMFFAREQGDRVNVSIAIIMSMTLYVLIASMSAPKSMNVMPLVGIFLIIQMLLLIGFTFVAIIRPKPYQLPISEAKNGSQRLKMSVWILRHWDRFMFVVYICASCLNSIIFLWIWPAIFFSSAKQ